MTAVNRSVARILALPEGRRLIAIAGPPASGKSWLAAKIVRRLQAGGHTAVVVPMDGFHLDNDILSERGMLARKGAPETFDADGFVSLIRRLAKAEDLHIPLFDRAGDKVLPEAGRVPADCRFVVVEGNYLLFDEAPWSLLAGIWDMSVFLDVPADELRSRLIRRWTLVGLTPCEACIRAEGNDMVNAKRIWNRQIIANLQF